MRKKSNRINKTLFNAAALLLCIAMLFACTACGSGKSPEPAPEETARPVVTATPQPTATPLPTATPEPTAEPASEPTSAPIDESDPIVRYMQTMTLREKVGQLFIIRPDALDLTLAAGDINSSSVEGVKTLTPALREVLANYPVGGFAIFSKNIGDPTSLKTFTAELTNAVSVPAFVSVDEEGGSVARLASNSAFNLPKYESAMAVGSTGDTSQAENMGRTIGAYLSEYGFSMDFAPVADVFTNPQNTVIGRRAFSTDAYTAAAMAGACASGLASQGIIPVYKHFPGHGDTAEDSHQGLAVTYKTHDELAACEWIPYSTNDLTGCAVMVAHVAAPNVTGTSTPSSLSYEMITGYLRGELGFTGLVITDALAMTAITETYSSGEAALAAFNAGADILLMPEYFTEAFDAILEAVQTGTISESRLDESVYRILQYKQMYGLFYAG